MAWKSLQPLIERAPPKSKLRLVGKEPESQKDKGWYPPNSPHIKVGRSLEERE
ncbi:MAG TPA: hypothetical protein VD928_01495 [Candidatus Paceibacterota bacterium]|nr:hypothetical protein [Candidatus Paceibacterota bacterium]